ncbi:MAG: DsrE/DsrF/TusD sulfur relay family protein [Cytophagaceae bacterium]
MEILFVINESPYGGEKSYNGLRTAVQLLIEDNSTIVNVFLMGDGVACSLSDQKPTSTSYNISTIISEIINLGGNVKLCKSCFDARGFSNMKLVEGVKISNMSEYAQLIIKCDKIFNV